jgi:hypothetical protein
MFLHKYCTLYIFKYLIIVICDMLLLLKASKYKHNIIQVHAVLQ